LPERVIDVGGREKRRQMFGLESPLGSPGVSHAGEPKLHRWIENRPLTSLDGTKILRHFWMADKSERTGTEKVVPMDEQQQKRNLIPLKKALAKGGFGKPKGL
jgi:hypothetical protein